MESSGKILKKLLRKVVYFAIGPLGGAAISFITVPITTWLVSPEQFGLTTMFTLFQTFLVTFIFLGMDQSFIREYNSYKYKKENLLYNAMFIPMIIAMIMMLIITIFRNSISVYLFSEINTPVMIALVIWIPFVVIERFLITNIRMQENGLRYSIFSIFVKLSVMITTIFLLLNFERTYTSIVLGTIIGQIIGNIFLIIASRQLFKLKILELDKALIKKMLQFGLPLLPAVIIMWVLNSTDRIVLDYFSTIEEIGIYFAAMKLVSLLAMVQTIFSTMWFPIAYRWHESKVETKKFTRVNYVLVCLMGVTFIIILLFKDVAIWILSPDYEKARYILPFLLFTPIMSTISDATSMGISISRKTHWIIWSALIATGVNIGINLLLVPTMGGVGAAIGTALGYIIFFWLRIIISRRYWYNFSLFPYFVNIFLLLTIASLNVVVKTNSIHIMNVMGLLIFGVVNGLFIANIFDVLKKR